MNCKDFLTEELTKIAETPTAFNVQQYLPFSGKRTFGPDEQKALDRAQQKIIPKIFQSKRDPAHVMLSSPLAAGIGRGAVTGLGGAGLGLVAGLPLSVPGTGAFFGGTAGALLGGLLGYWKRKKKNEDILGILERLPSGATIRDYEGDAVVQADRTRADAKSDREARLRAARIARGLED